MKYFNRSITTILFLGALLAIVAISCQKKPINYFNPSRMFTPTGITITGGDTSAIISWPASLNSSAKSVTYTVEISKDITFQSAPALTLMPDTNFVKVTDDSLKDRQLYFVRLKANASGGSTESNWLTDSTGFTLVGVQIFANLPSSNIIDNEVILNWTPTQGVSKIILTASNGDTIQVPLSDSDNTAGQKLITGLMASTQYTAEIFAGSKSKGLLTFTTKASIAGTNIIDLRGITNNMEVLYDTLPQIPDGSIVLLKRGMTYSIPSAYTIDRAVTIMSGLGFGDPAIVMLGNNFDASGNIDSIRFQDLTIANNGSSYFMNVGNTAVIGQLSIVNCTTEGIYSNSFIRLKTAGDEIKNLTIDNCIIDSFGIASKYAVLYANASSSAVIDNINITNSTFYSFYYFIRQDGVSPPSLVINNCTFNDMINQGGYFINYSGTFPPDFTISNSIFGNTNDPTNSNGIKSSGNAVIVNSYIVSDCVFSANPITGATAYSGTAADLFTDPANGNFTIKDNSFAGKSSAGDSRWR